MRIYLVAAMLAACSGADTTPPAEPEKAPGVEPAPAPEPAAPPAAAALTGNADGGKVVYEQYCQACHQADGKGSGGMLAADFTADPSRLAKSDAELLSSINDGYKGSVGIMPPWKGTVSPQEQADVLAYIRAQFGS
jgi:cytochrome c oxidase cbb3-type subunit 3